MSVPDAGAVGAVPGPRLGDDSTVAPAPVPGAKWWWVALVLGILWVVFGMMVLSLRPGTLGALAILAGIAFIAGGVSQFMIATRVESWQWLFWVGGVLGIIAGIAALAWPGETLLVLSVFLSWYLVFAGIFSIIGAFMGPKREWWWIGILVGVLEFILGVWAIGSPGRQLLLLVNIVGIYAILYGVSEIFSAFALKSARTA
jgi:uncharacterized membrane protein HdeD (DUF308 family)